MSEDDKRNTAIVKLNERSSVSISDLQAFQSTGNTRSLLGFGSITAYLLNSYTKTISQLLAKSYDDQRNTLISFLAAEVSSYSVSDLQALGDLELVGVGLQQETSFTNLEGYSYIFDKLASKR